MSKLVSMEHSVKIFRDLRNSSPSHRHIGRCPLYLTFGTSSAMELWLASLRNLQSVAAEIMFQVARHYTPSINVREYLFIITKKRITLSWVESVVLILLPFFLALFLRRVVGFAESGALIDFCIRFLLSDEIIAGSKVITTTFKKTALVLMTAR
jgi:hypothetical protein